MGMNQNTEEFIPDICIEGYDPFPVVFRDMSDVRSFKTKFWKYDFGDSIIFGCDTSNSANPDRNFELPGDSYIISVAGPTFINNVDYFHGTQEKCLMNLDATGYASYHSDVGASMHYTGIHFKSSNKNTSGSTSELDPVLMESSGEMYRFRRLPNTSTTEYIEVTGIDDSIIEDQCARNNCEFEYDFGNSVLHVYKGPGLYYATMTCSSEDALSAVGAEWVDKGLQGMEVSEDIFLPTSEYAEKIGYEDPSGATPKIKEHVTICGINVLPECPCVSGFRVYGPISGDPDNFITITNSAFSCDDKNLASCTGKTGFNCYVEFEDFDGSTRVTSAVSGYAPYMYVAASGIMIPRSLPVTGAWVDWSDWATDYMRNDETRFGPVTGGWPTWGTEDGRDISGNPSLTPAVTGEHVYTLPGLYSVGIAPEFDIERITKYMPTVTNYEDCVESTLRRSASGSCIVVVEIPPKANGITYSTASESSGATAHPSVLTDIKASFKAGSYPISRIDWDFGDGSEIMTISTEGYKVVEKTDPSGQTIYDVSGNTSSGAVFVDYTNSTTTAVPFGSGNVSDGYFVGNPISGECDGRYLRWDCRNYVLQHVYTRTSVDDHPNGYVITCSAYAENTNTCAVATTRVFPSGAGLPHFDEVEEYVEMSDIRSDNTGETNIVLQSVKEDRLYVNRASDTDEDLGSNRDETPAFPRKPKDDDDEPKPGDIIYCFDGVSERIPDINRFIMCFKDERKPLSRGPVFTCIVSDVDQFGKTWYVKLTAMKDLYEGSRSFDDGKKIFEFPINLDWVIVNGSGEEIDPDVPYYYDPMVKWGKYPPQKIRIEIDESEDESGDITTGTAVVSLMIGESYDQDTRVITYDSLVSENFEYSKTIIADPDIDGEKSGLMC